MSLRREQHVPRGRATVTRRSGASCWSCAFPISLKPGVVKPRPYHARRLPLRPDYGVLR